MHILDRTRCVACGACAALCPEDALSLSCRRWTLGEALQEIERDKAFYEASGGGVTLSGGEPLLQPEFVIALADACREKGFSVLLDTAGDVPEADFARVLPHVDAVYMDLKTADAADAARYTGGDTARIRRNLCVAAAHPGLTVRVPLIPGVNTGEKLDAIGRAALESGAKKISLLPFHRLGSSKYAALGRSYAFAETEPLGREALREAAARLEGAGLSVETE